MTKKTANIFTREMTLLRRVTLSTDEQDGNNVKTITIGDFLAPERQSQYREQVERIRSLCPDAEAKKRNRERVSALKKTLPAGIISGVADCGIGEDSIIERNGVIAADIDAADNPALHDWEAVKAVVSKSPYIAYAGLSVSGLGIFALIPVEDATRHKAHFAAIVQDFARTTFTLMQAGDAEPTLLHGIRIDTAPSNIASKRFVSFDPHPYWNEAAQVYPKTIEPLKLYVRRYTASRKGEPFDVERFLDAHDIAYNVRERHGGLQYIVSCPWRELHSSRSKAESAVFVDSDGRPGYKCMHSHCYDKHWQEFRQFYEPNAYKRATPSRFPRLRDLGL